MNTIVVDYDTFSNIVDNFDYDNMESVKLFDNFIFNNFCINIDFAPTKCLNGNERKKCFVEFFDGAKNGKAKIEFIDEINSCTCKVAAKWNFSNEVFESKCIELDLDCPEMKERIFNEFARCPSELEYQTYCDGVLEQCHFEAECEINSILRLCNHILINSANREEIVRKALCNKQNNSNASKSSENKVFLFNDIVKYIYEESTSNSSKKNIHCPCWSVRGHYRHYKSGKVVFIRSYEKGKDKGNSKAVDKTYIVGKSGVNNVRI